MTHLILKSKNKEFIYYSFWERNRYMV